MASVADTLTALRMNFDGQPWHGSALRTLLEGIDDEKAHARPLSEAKTIAGLLAHIIAWIEIVDRRIQGEQLTITPEIDFPDATNQRWSLLMEQLDAAQARLVETLSRLEDADLARKVAGKDYSIRFMLSGLMHHNTYHAGQIALLKKG